MYGLQVQALVDSGCSQSIMSKQLLARCMANVQRRLNDQDCIQVTRICGTIRMLDGSCVSYQEKALVQLLCGGKLLKLSVLVVPQIVSNMDFIFGMDAIQDVGGVCIANGTVYCMESGDGAELFHCVPKDEGTVDSIRIKAGTVPVIDDDDFVASFDDELQRWTVRWKWANATPQYLKNHVGQYRVADAEKEEFNAEVNQWIVDGYLQLYDGKPEDIKGIIPLMSVYQRNKNKVRPVLDFRELNEYLSRHTRDAVVCADKLRLWRRFGNKLAVLDLRRAYLQVFVEKDLQLYQAVKFQGKTYLMTRMAFGLSVAPKIMTAIVEAVLSVDDSVRKGTESYIDDILIDEDVIDAECVEELLLQHGLEAKPVERVSSEGIRLLGLRVILDSASGQLVWKRDGSPPSVENVSLTRRKVFSICGSLVGHYPVAGWLRTACGFIKRQTGQQSWDEQVSAQVVDLVQEVLARVNGCDPVGGAWMVSDTKVGEVWADASGLAYGACVRIDGTIVEDASWLRSKEDTTHINVAELDASLKGINMALRWRLQNITLYTDSKTCFDWLNGAVTNRNKLHTKGMSEMLIRRRLTILKELISQYDLKIIVHHVPSGQNIADCLTRVPRKWWKSTKFATSAVGQVGDVRLSHGRHHFGVEKTFQLLDPEIRATRADVEHVVKSCVPCNTVDPAVRDRWKVGGIGVNKVWSRVAIDVTHCNDRAYLTAVDCCSRYAVWKLLRDESAVSVTFALEDLFGSLGPPGELLMDNAPVFCSEYVSRLLNEWDVKPLFSAAYRPQGNGLIERNHRTIKRSVERSGVSVQKIVAFYNNTTHSATGAVPYEVLFVARSKITGCREQREELSERPTVTVSDECDMDTQSNPFKLGELVYFKPVSARCTSHWLGPRRICKVVDDVKVELESVPGPRHISHVRRCDDDSMNLSTDTRVTKK